MMELEDDPEHVTSGEAKMQCEEPGTSSTQVKRVADELEESDAMVQLMEVLQHGDARRGAVTHHAGEW